MSEAAGLVKHHSPKSTHGSMPCCRRGGHHVLSALSSLTLSRYAAFESLRAATATARGRGGKTRTRGHRKTTPTYDVQHRLRSRPEPITPRRLPGKKSWERHGGPSQHGAGRAGRHRPAGRPAQPQRKDVALGDEQAGDEAISDRRTRGLMKRNQSRE